MSKHLGFVWACLVSVLVVLRPASADWKDDIGYTQLVTELGSVETGAGIVVSQVEANAGDPNLGQFIYMPANSSQFAGKTFTDGSGLSTANSGHARNVGLLFYGNIDSIAPGVSDITGYEAVDYLERVLGFTPGTDPLSQPFKVQNHSWVGGGLSVADAVNLLRRFDHVADRDDVTMVVGVANNSAAALPQLMGQAYNVISVGRQDGNHSDGPTTLYGPGRVKPEIVAPGGTQTSFTTAMVSSAAALLHARAQNVGNSDAGRSEVIKASLLAGATKDEFPGWSRTTTRPLDSRFGAGELNIYNSYFITSGGEFDGTTSGPGVSVARMGWDYGEMISPANPLYYNLDFGGTQSIAELSVILAWNMHILDGDPSAQFNPVEQLADMTLRLYDSSGSFLGTLIDQSISSVDNVEHIFALNLAPGTYTLEVASNMATDFGLAWRITTIPEPSGAIPVLAVIGAVVLGRWRVRRHSTPRN